MDNLSSSAFTLRPRTRVGVLRGVDHVVNDVQKVDFEVTSDEIKVTKAEGPVAFPSAPVDISGFDGTPEQQARIRHLLEKHKDVFATHDFDLGDTNTVEHHIETTTSQPISQTHRRIPPNQYQEVKKV